MAVDGDFGEGSDRADLVTGGDPRLRVSAVELAEQLRSGSVRAGDLIESVLGRIRAVDSEVNAFASLQADAAIRVAAAIGPGDSRPFAGVPIAVKDSVAQRGIACPIGSRLFRSFRPDYDSATVARLQRAGFVIVGRTTMPELGILASTEPELTGVTRNPYAPDRTPGGSSGGAAAAVAAGMVPIAHGGDGGGSLRIPAACCALIGLKPSRGLISHSPQAGDDPLVSEGVLTTTVADTAALLDVLAGYEIGDATWAPLPAEPYLTSVGRVRLDRVEPLRIGLALQPPMPAELDPSCARAAVEAGRALEGLGHHVEEMTLPGLDHDVRAAFDRQWAVMAGQGVQAAQSFVGHPITADDMEPLTWALFEQARGIDAIGYRTAQSTTQAAARRIVAATAPFDAVITPALAQPPVPIGRITGSLEPDPLEALARSDAFSPYTAIWNLTGQPALSLPWPSDADRLPRGVQLVGRPLGDATLLGLARQLELAGAAARVAPR